MLDNADNTIPELTEVGKKVSKVIQKYKDMQLPFFDQLRVLDPRQMRFMPHRLNQYWVW